MLSYYNQIWLKKMSNIHWKLGLYAIKKLMIALWKSSYNGTKSSQLCWYKHGNVYMSRKKVYHFITY